MYNADGVLSKVTSIDFIEADTQVYDFNVESVDTYLAGGYLIHNTNGEVLK